MVNAEARGAPIGWLPMTYQVKHARSGLTAIAAVLALSSTPLAAQEVADSLAPTPETTATPAPETTAPEPEATTSEPVAETTAAEPAAPATTTRQTATRSRTTTTTTRRATSVPTAAAPAAAAPATEAPAEGMTVPPPSAMVDPGPMPVDETAMETTAAPADDALPIAGAAGLALLALGGIGMAVGRRRQRRDEQAHSAANRAYLDSHPASDAATSNAPVFASTASPGMATAASGRAIMDAPRTKLPPNFDLSRFGPHVRAAYQGPTEDNPSLSMRHRLRRAAALDQQLRQHGEVPRETVHGATPTRDTVQAAPVRSTRPQRPIWNSNNDGFMLRRAGSKSASKPAFQH